MASAQEIAEKLLSIGVGVSGDANNMWDKTTNCNMEEVREVMAVSRGSLSGHRGDWLWNGDDQGKVVAKKVVK